MVEDNSRKYAQDVSSKNSYSYAEHNENRITNEDTPTQEIITGDSIIEQIKEALRKKLLPPDEQESVEHVKSLEEILLAKSDTRYKIVKNGKRRIFECAACGQTFHRKDIFEKHYTIHSGVFPYVCTLCGHKTRQNTCMKRHMMLQHKMKLEYKDIPRNNIKRVRRSYNSETDLNILKKKRYKILKCGRRTFYKCTICSKIFKSLSSSKRHFLQHTGERPFTCSLCDYKTTQKYHLRQHLKTKHNIDDSEDEIRNELNGEDVSERENEKKLRIKCKRCNKIILKENFKRHMLAHTKIRIYLCSVCGYRCKTRIGLMDHMHFRHYEVFRLNGVKEAVEEKSEYTCKICDRPFLYKSRFEQHMRVHTGIRPYKCSFCEYNSSAKRTMKLHIKSKHDIDVCLDEILEDLTVDKYEIKRQLAGNRTEITGASTHKENFYRCKYCPYICTVDATLIKHMRTHLPRENKENNAVKNNTEDEMHSQLTEEVKMDIEFDEQKITVGDSTTENEKSEQNIAESNQIENTRYRIIKDGEVKAYQCTMCTKVSKEKYLAERHFLQHTGEFPLSCSLCDVKVRQKKSMRLHLKKEHDLDVSFKDISKDGRLRTRLTLKPGSQYKIVDKNGIRIYQCNICNKRSNRKESFDKHFARHTGVYPYSCKLCNYKSVEKRCMKKHMFNHHEISVDCRDIQKSELNLELDCSNYVNLEESEIRNSKENDVIGQKEVKFNLNTEEISLTENEIKNERSALNDSSELKDTDSLDNKKASPLEISLIENDIKNKPSAFKESSEFKDTGSSDNKKTLPLGRDRYTVIEQDNMKLYKCTVCDKIVDDKFLLNAHFLEHTGKLPYWCTLCGHKARLKKTIKNHMRRRHKINVSTEDIPGEPKEVESEEEEAQEPIIEFDGEQYTIVEECGMKFFKCTICDKILKKKHQFDRHFLIHKREFPYPCTMCRYKTREKKSLRSHLRARHKIEVYMKDILKNGEIKKTDTTENKEYACTFCNKIFHSSYYFNKHKRVHSNDRPFLCSYCQYKSKDKYYLRLHIFTQHNIYVSPEDIVPNATSDQSNIKSETLKSEEKAPSTDSASEVFKCEQCPYTCTVPGTLTKHLREVHYFKSETLKSEGKTPTTDSASKVFKCEQCPYICTVLRTFTKHLNEVHSLENSKSKTPEHLFTDERSFTIIKEGKKRLYKCGICDETASVKRVFYRHFYQHSTKLPILCSMCDFRAGKEATMMRHINEVHKNMIEELLENEVDESKAKLNVYKCEHCPYIFTSQETFSEHNKMHSSNDEKEMIKDCRPEDPEIIFVKQEVSVDAIENDI